MAFSLAQVELPFDEKREHWSSKLAPISAQRNPHGLPLSGLAPTERHHGPRHRQRALLAPLQRHDPDFPTRFLPEPIILLLARRMFLARLHDPDPGLLRAGFVRLQQTLPRRPVVRRRVIVGREPRHRHI